MENVMSKMVDRKVTLYFRGGLGILKIEAKSYAAVLGPYAQYTSAVHVAWIQKGKRLVRGIVQTFQPDLLILDGWNHPEPDAVFGAPTVTGDGVSTQRARHSACSPEWSREFDSMIGQHISSTGAKVVEDFRGHNSHGALQAA